MNTKQAESSQVISAEKKYWNPFFAVAITLGIFLVSQFLASFVLSFIFMIYAMVNFWIFGDVVKYNIWLENGAFPKFLYILIIDIIVVILVLIALKRKSLSFKDIGWKRFRKKDITLAMMGFLTYFGLYFVVAIVAKWLIPSLDVNQRQELGFEQTKQFFDLLLIGISLVILPPLVEELLMRGFLYTNLRANLKYIPSLLITSIIFASLHLQFDNDAPLLWVAAIDTFVLSAVLVSIRERSNSLWPAILVHMFKNGLAFILLFIFKVG